MWSPWWPWLICLNRNMHWIASPFIQLHKWGKSCGICLPWAPVTHVFPHGKASLFLITEYYPCMCVCVLCVYHISYFTYPLICCWTLVLTPSIIYHEKCCNMQISLKPTDVISLGYIPGSGIAGLDAVVFLIFWGSSILFSMMTILTTPSALFHSM